VQAWNGKCFVKSTLFDQGFIMNLGHGGEPCPHSPPHADIWEDVEMSEMDFGGEEPIEEQDWGKGSSIIIAHSSGVFQHQVNWCRCDGDAPKHLQLFREGLFPASITNPKTAFTFDVLDHFYIDAMECKTAAMSFFQKLRRFTHNAAPSTVPVSISAHLISIML
jgi:hypothetical protein